LATYWNQILERFDFLVFFLKKNFWWLKFPKINSIFIIFNVFFWQNFTIYNKKLYCQICWLAAASCKMELFLGDGNWFVEEGVMQGTKFCLVWVSSLDFATLGKIYIFIFNFKRKKKGDYHSTIHEQFWHKLKLFSIFSNFWNFILLLLSKKIYNYYRIKSLQVFYCRVWIELSFRHTKLSHKLNNSVFTIIIIF